METETCAQLPKKHTHKINPGSVACWKRVQCLVPRKGTVLLFTGEQNSAEVFLSEVKTARETQASLPPPPVVFETRLCVVGGGGSASHTFTPLLPTACRTYGGALSFVDFWECDEHILQGGAAETLHSRPELLKRELLFHWCVRSLTSPR